MTGEGLSVVECWKYVCGFSLQELELLTFQKKQQNVSSCPFWALHTFFASAFHEPCFVHVGISPTILRTSQRFAFIGWSPGLIRWIKYGQFAFVVFLYIYLSFSFVRLFLETDRVGLPSVHAVRFNLNQYCKQRIDWIASKQNWGTDVSLLTQVFVCCASRWPRQPLNLPRLGMAWPC